MKKIKKEDIKKFWKTNKKKLIAGSVAIGMATVYLVIRKKNKADPEVIWEREFLNGMIKANKASIGSRPIPSTELFKILDIADDVNDGCVTWLDGCKLSDCGKLGEGLMKIDNVGPDMMVTMAILAKDKLKF